MSRRGRILFIDAYDSFSNNIIALLEAELRIVVHVIKIDDPRFVLNNDAFFDFLDHFDAVVAGPGPGHPAVPADAGLIAKLWTLPDERLIPVLGICFGFQSLALHFGARIEPLKEPRHGLVTPVFHCNQDIFADTGKVIATQYHSLHVRLGQDKVRRVRRSPWTPSRSCAELIPLAWDMSGTTNGEVLMAVKHCHKPFWGVQYHPESICTNEEGSKLIANWAFQVVLWKIGRPVKNSSTRSETKSHHVVPISLNIILPKVVKWRKIALGSLTILPRLIELLRTDQLEPLLLESGMRNGKPVNEETGRFSIVGFHDSSSTHVRYSRCNRQVSIVSGNVMSTIYTTTSTDVFGLLQNFVKEQSAVEGPSNVPFWGGLMGFISYEAGLETINVGAEHVNVSQPDVWFVLVERSIVIDHLKHEAYIQTIRNEDECWLSFVEKRLQELLPTKSQDISSVLDAKQDAALVSSPEHAKYCQKVQQCQHHLRAGSSYELCLTDTTLVHTESNPWQLYLRLRDLNPAPFGAYISLPPSTLLNLAPTQGISIISSSPERFLSWSRMGQCQFRPIKGTVKKSPDVDRAKAEELLNCPKERAENLMIVDLIRHDLNGVKGVRNVRVPKLMSVEEYETVFQLVSVIEGDLIENESGIRVLAASLPPGSMTGAPKKRSCELLKEIENRRPRGVYSGVIGYLDFGGGGDFSVVIRTAFKWSGETEWRVGAGGAVTALSDPDAEWQEMMAKRESVLGAFGERSQT